MYTHVAVIVITFCCIRAGLSQSSHSCHTVSEDGQSKEYCLYMESKDWDGANNACQPDGRLAGDPKGRHAKILHEMMTSADVTQAWIGGRTGPLYWNWINPDDHTHRPTTSQGCFQVPSNKTPNSMNHHCRPANLECHKHCHDLDFKYFELQNRKGESSLCCCRNNIVNLIPASCQSQDGRAVMYVYSTHEPFAKDIRWLEGHPTSLSTDRGEALCLALRLVNGSFLFESDFCNRTKAAVCVGRNCERPDENLCLESPSSDLDWKTTMAECSQNQRKPLSFYNPEFYNKLSEKAFSQLGASEDNSWWVFGTSRRWLWVTEDTIPVEISGSRWSDPEFNEAREDSCLVIDQSGNLSALHCTEHLKAYICQKVTVPETEDSQDDNTLVFVGIGIGSLFLLLFFLSLALVIIFSKRRKSPGTSPLRLYVSEQSVHPYTSELSVNEEAGVESVSSIYCLANYMKKVDDLSSSLDISQGGDVGPLRYEPSYAIPEVVTANNRKGISVTQPGPSGRSPAEPPNVVSNKQRKHPSPFGY